MRWLVVILSLAFALARADAETIALLPLDGEQRLAIYSQPVAAEIGRALKAAGIDVVVVGARMDVPDTAQLIVDGTIKGKGKTVTLSIRVRDPRDGTILDTLPAPATALDKIDKAAAELSSRVVPSVRSHLEAIAKAKAAAAVNDKPPVDMRPPQPPQPVAPALPVMLTAVDAKTSPSLQLLRNALGSETPAWVSAHKREAKTTAKELLIDRYGKAIASRTVVDHRADLAIVLEVLSYSVARGKVPMARARVRVLVADASEVKFDRVVRTDTVVGDRDSKPDELARRTAREVLAIVNANLRRQVKSWR